MKKKDREKDKGFPLALSFSVFPASCLVSFACAAVVWSRHATRSLLGGGDYFLSGLRVRSDGYQNLFKLPMIKKHNPRETKTETR